jgi:hypothetical protein
MEDLRLAEDDVSQCTDPIVQQRIEQTLELINNLPEEQSEALKKLLSQKYLCQGGTWSVDDLDDLFKDLWEEIEGSIEDLAESCPAAVTAVVAVCGIEVGTCIVTIVNGGNASVCYTDATGQKICEPISDDTGCKWCICALEAGFVAYRGSDPCLDTIEWAEKKCGANGDDW